MAKISREEYEVLKGLDDDWKWIARDEDEDLWVFTEKPVRKSESDIPPYWDTETGRPHSTIELIDEIHLFHFIQWEDEEPYDIQELIEEYEIENGMRYDFGKIKVVDIDTSKLATKNGYIYVIESEETEVKSKQELIEKWESAIEAAEFYGKGKEERLISYMKDFMSDLNQLDEPEVLSQEWVDRWAITGETLKEWGFYKEKYIHVKNLQNLLVPKQEITYEDALKVIAENIGTDEFSIGLYLEALNNNEKYEFLTEKWIEDNTSPVDEEGRLYVWKRDLQNVIVPKQEENNNELYRKFVEIVQMSPASAHDLLNTLANLVAKQHAYGTEKQEITEEQAWEVIGEAYAEDGKGALRNPKQLFDSGRSLMRVFNTVEFELDSRNDKRRARDFIFEAIDNLDKIVIEKPTIPQFIADWVEESRNRGYNIRGVFEEAPKIVENWLYFQDDGERIVYLGLAYLLDEYVVEEEQKYVIDTDDVEISDGNHYLTHLSLSKDDTELPIVGYKDDAIRFDNKEQAQAIASYVGGRVEELGQ